MKKWLAAISCTLLFTIPAGCQQLIFKTYTVEDGLVSNPVRRIYQDRMGFIWICSQEGLSKYDGHRFSNFTTANGLSHNLVNDIYESEDAKLYVAENNGNIDILEHNAIVKKAAFRNIIVNRFYHRKATRVFAATDTSGFYEFNNGSFVKPVQAYQHATYNDLTALNDSLLIAGAEGTLHILNKQYRLYAALPQPRHVLTHKIFRDSKNRVWVGTNYGLKLVTFGQPHQQPEGYSLVPAPFAIPVLRNSAINDILEDVNGNLWIACSRGLVKICPDTRWQLFVEKDGLPSSNISCVYQDREKNIWIGTTLGLAKLVTGNNIVTYTGENGLVLSAWTYLCPLKNQQFIIGAETGLKLFNTTTKKNTAISSHYFYTGFVQNSSPALFFGNDNRFGKYDSVKQHIVDDISVQPRSAEVYCSVMDANGIIFNGTQNGLVIRLGGNSYYEPQFTHRITALLADKKGDLWVGTWNNGLYRIRYKPLSNLQGGHLISLSVMDLSGLLPDKNIRCLLEDGHGRIWVGTRNQGITVLSSTNSQPRSSGHFDLQQGLMSNWTRTIAEDARGCIWIGSDLGIDKLIPNDTAFRVFNFSRVTNFFDQVNAILPGPDHSLWIAANKGLVNTIDEEMEKMPPAPVYITSVNAGDSNFNYNSYQAKNKLQLNYKQNQAGFSFSAPTFINEKQILYSYRLLGSIDTGWSKPSNLHNVSYASLQSGNYRFEVRTAGWNGAWGAAATFEFGISPPFWQTWWFYLLELLLLVFLFYAFYRYRIRQLKNLQRVRNRIATDLHDDIGSTLSNINILSELSRKSAENPAQVHLFLNRISEEAQASSQSLDDIIWSVDTKNDNWEETFSRMRRYAAEVFENNGAQYSFTLDEHFETTKLYMGKRRDIFLIYKELLNNVHKHAGATKVDIDLRFSDHQLNICIKDNGSGFDQQRPTERNGLKNLSKRVAYWKGKLAIETGPGGTLVQITI